MRLFIVTESDLFSLKPTQSHKEVWVCCTFVLAISKVAFMVILDSRWMIWRPMQKVTFN